jgi:arylsulfatase A-like enzyme/tetratricopeptide (TPR) repeat protein
MGLLSLASGLAGLLAAGACVRGSAAKAPASSHPNVLLVTIDTQRADHLGCYGYKAAVTPTLDALAARGVRFATAVGHAPLTAPSHASILTGLTPLKHGVRDNGAFVLPAAVRTLAQDFQAAGYRTAAFVSGFPLKRRFGFDRGFELYDDHLPRGKDARRTAYVERTADRTTDAALAWLDAPPAAGRDGSPLFLWVHYFDPHAPYEAPAEFMSRVATPYDGETAFVDAQLARLLQHFDAAAKGRPGYVLVTADHGESLGEHGEDTHGIFVYDATIRVPFLLAGPGLGPRVVERPVARGIDVVPTLLDYAGLAARSVEGRSLRRAAEGERLADEASYAESLHPQLQYGWAPLHAWRTARYKVIEAPRLELYDLEADPGETRDRSGEEATRLAGLRSELQRAMATTTPDAAQAADAETQERLAALGYVGTAGKGAPPPSGRDPKDGIALATRLGRNGMTVARTEPQKAIRELTALLAEDPGMLVALRTRAVAYAAAGRPADAVRDLRDLEKRGALSSEDAVVLGDNLRLAGRLQDAAQVLERTSRDNPKFPQPLLSLAAVRLQESDVEAAAAAYAKALDLDPDNPEALRGMGDVALARGDLARAATAYGRIVELDPADAAALTKLGVVRMRSGSRDEATSLLQRAVEREPKNAEALLYLAGALASSGRARDAVPYFERALAAGPRTTMALNGLGLTRLELGDRPGALAAFRESLRLDAHQPDVADKLRELGRP